MKRGGKGNVDGLMNRVVISWGGGDDDTRHSSGQ